MSILKRALSILSHNYYMFYFVKDLLIAVNFVF